MNNPKKVCTHHDCRYWKALTGGSDGIDMACHYMLVKGKPRERDEKDCYSYKPKKHKRDCAKINVRERLFEPV